MALLGARVVALFSLFGLTMLAGLGPVFIFRWWHLRQQRLTVQDGSKEPFDEDSEEERRGGGVKVSSKKRRVNGAKVLHLLLVFGGGVLLATCFVHMIPEILENYDSYLKNQGSPGRLWIKMKTMNMEESITHQRADVMAGDQDDNSINNETSSRNNVSSLEPVQRSYDYSGTRDNELNQDESKSRRLPWVEICICLGLFMTYFIEEIILLLIGNHHHHHHNNNLNPPSHGKDHHHHHQQQQPHHDHCNSREIIGCLPETNEGDYGTLIRPVPCPARNSNECFLIGGGTGGPSRQRFSSNTPHSKGFTITDDARDLDLTIPLHGTLDQPPQPEVNAESLSTRFLRGLIIVIAFLAHSIFDGVAIGLQTSTYSLWTMFFAICLHKLVVVFAIGFELFEKTGSLLLTSIHITIFSLMSPFGILLAIVTEEGLSEDGSLTLILLNAVATGAILYIVFLEILQADRCPDVNGLAQLFSLVAGFTLMTVMTVLVSDGD